MKERQMPFQDDLSDLAGLGDDQTPLAESALRIALLEYPRLDPAPSLRELDALAARARDLADGPDSESLVAALNTALFVEAGFTGNASAYYDPKNSFLNDVLERRTGIPITLSVVYLEVGWRIGLALRGIGFPGHFLVGHDSAGELSLLDPFNGGAAMSRDECAALVPATDDGDARLDDMFFKPVSNRQILLRMLTNLKLIYVQRLAFDRAVTVIDRILQLEPGALTEIRDRGLVRLQAGEVRLAAADLEAFLDRAPAGADRETAVTALGAARRALARFN
jgi:regulator of sirC expression with transglutaminase-like and TPR domain